MIDLRSDTVTKPTEAMRAAMARAEVGDDVYGEDPTVNALEERVAELFGHEAALFTPTGSMANVLAVRSLVASRRGGALRVARAHRPGRAGRARRLLGRHHAHLDRPARPGRPGHDPVACSRPTWARSSCPPRRSRSRTPTTSAAERCCRSADLRDLREFATAAGARVHLDGARIWNAHVATGTPLREYGAVADVLAVCLSKGLGAPVGSLMVGDRRRDRRGAGVAQADGRRDAPGRRPGRGRPARPRPPRRAPRRRPRPRPAARRGLRRRPGVGRHQHRGRRAPGCRRLRVPRPRRRRSGRRRWVPPPYAWSPTSASTAPTRRPRRPRSRRSRTG